MGPNLLRCSVFEGSTAAGQLCFWLPVFLPVSSLGPYTSLYLFFPTALVCSPFICFPTLSKDCIQWEHLESFPLGFLVSVDLIGLHPCIRALIGISDALKLASSTLCCLAPLCIHTFMVQCVWLAFSKQWVNEIHSYLVNFYQYQVISFKFPAAWSSHHCFFGPQRYLFIWPQIWELLHWLYYPLDVFFYF